MSKIIFALDVGTSGEATVLADRLTPYVGAFKVGLELFMAVGPQIIRYMTDVTDMYAPVMLDLKLHDIPETVERAVLRAGDLGVTFLTLHVQQKETLRRAVKAAEKGRVQLLGVTVLTSMNERDLDDLRYSTTDPTLRADYLARMAWEEGITGFVCSPKDLPLVRAGVPKAVLVVPGIRPLGAEKGDQKRTGTPAEAIKEGADYLVIGRPIRDAKDPVAAAQAINEEIDAAR
jgi:orotidine-5'-phosphate decarboxylase